MRHISFSATLPQFRARTKTVTRRLGWKCLKAGDVLMAVEQTMGIPKGGHQEPLGKIEVVSVRREPLNDITPDDVPLEGFPWLTPLAFVKFFASNFRCAENATVTRIEFKYL